MKYARFGLITNTFLIKLGYKFLKSKWSKWIPEEEKQYMIQRIEALDAVIRALKDELKEP